MTTQVKPPPAASGVARRHQGKDGTATPPVKPLPAIAAAAPPAPARASRKFTVSEYYRMAEVGILHPTERVELIDGEIIVMAPIGEPHATGVDRLTLAFAEVSRGRFIVRVQNPIRLNDGGAPQPDLVILRLREDFYISAHPGPGDVLLIIEVSDSTLDFDREVKSQRYAAAGIPETWVLNLPEDCLERFTAPGPQGYARHAILRRGDKVSPIALPDLELAVDELLPPARSVE